MDNLPNQKLIMRWLMGVCVAVFILVGYITFLAPPAAFPTGKIIHIESGWSAGQTAEFLASQGIVRQPTLFKALSVVTGQSRQLVAGYYLMDKPASVFNIFNRVAVGDYHLKAVRFTFLEGTSAREMADSLKDNLTGFNDKKFLTLALPNEGYLYPDTYFFYPGTSEEEIVATMENNFYQHFAPLNKELAESRRSLNDVLTMASILEKEAYTVNDQKIISGILWKRIKAKMPLQVDAVFPYIIGKNSFTLTLADLRIDSPYNTYRYPGLPPAPIGNPGLAAIKAALEPTNTSYWFYLSDLNGNMHYSANFAQHKQYKAKYLD